MKFELNIEPKNGDPFIEFVTDNGESQGLEDKVIERFIELANSYGIVLSEPKYNSFGNVNKYKIQIDR